MDDFSKYFKSMLDQIMKSGGDINFDIKAFDLNGKESDGSNFMQMIFGGMPFNKKEKLAVRKLTEEEIEQYKALMESKDALQSQFRRLMNQQKKLEADFELFWQDAKEATKLKTDIKALSVDIDSGFLFQEVNVNQKEKQEE
jgi:hypothetical protein